jgi:hypothetical protein
VDTPGGRHWGLLDTKISIFPTFLKNMGKNRFYGKKNRIFWKKKIDFFQKKIGETI